MQSCWRDEPDNRPTFEAVYRHFDEFMIQAEPSYREVDDLLMSFKFCSKKLIFVLDMIYLRRQPIK